MPHLLQIDMEMSDTKDNDVYIIAVLSSHHASSSRHSFMFLAIVTTHFYTA